jgi:hypothetical protein
VKNLYRNSLISSVENLKTARQQLFVNLVNLAMNNEMQEISEAFEIGETYDFSLEHFEHSKDVNVQKLSALIRDIDNTIASYININNLSKNEMLEFKNQSE